MTEVEKRNGNAITLPPQTIYLTRLQQILSDTGECSSGIVAIEAWVMNDKKTRLVRPEGAWWRDPSYQSPAGMDDNMFRRLEDPSAEDYINVEQVKPGVGLAGQLWAERTMTTVRSGDPVMSLSDSYRSFLLKLRSKKGSQFIMSYTEECLIWRELEFTNANPHQIADNRIEAFLGAGIGKVAGVPFELPDTRGIVLFYAKTYTNTERLDKRNVKFLIKSASLIGSVLSLSDSIIASWEAKQEELAIAKHDSFDDVENNKQSLDTESNSAGTDTWDSSPATPSNMKRSRRCEYFDCSCLAALRQKLAMLKDKTFDSHQIVEPPPSMPNAECIWTFMGSFLSLVSISYSAKYITVGSMPLGPLGAFIALLYGLTSAPAGQPRNAIYGSFIAGSVALGLSYIPTKLINLRLSLAASISIALMARLGVTHPPAGALAVLLSMNDNYDWVSLLLYLMGSLMAIAIAIIVNNLNEKRAYPQYWKLAPVPTSCCRKRLY